MNPTTIQHWIGGPKSAFQSARESILMRAADLLQQRDRPHQGSFAGCDLRRCPDLVRE